MTKSAQLYRTIPGTQSLDRGLSVLKLVVANNGHGLRLVDIVNRCGLERPTAHRIVQELVKQNLVKRLADTRRYVLGDYWYEIVVALSDRNDLRAICFPVLRNISSATGNSAFLVVRMGIDSICIARTIGNYPIQVLSIRVGNRMPLGIGAGGLAILAEIDEDERNLIYKANQKRLQGFGNMSVPVLKGLVKATKARGHSVVGHYSVPGVIGIGIVLRNSQNQVVGSITTASVANRMTKTHQSQSADYVFEAIKIIQPKLDLLTPYVSE